MKKHSQPAKRKPRTDALRNRERILEVAKGAFTCHGASTSLDDIAKQAGFGAPAPPITRLVPHAGLLFRPNRVLEHVDGTIHSNRFPPV
jgi:hypothetical protein